MYNKKVQKYFIIFQPFQNIKTVLNRGVLFFIINPNLPHHKYHQIVRTKQWHICIEK